MSPVTEHPTVISPEGASGRVESDAPEERDGDLKVLVNFENGERLWVPAQLLILQADGNFQLQMSLAELSRQHTQPTVAARPADPEALLAAAQDQAAQHMARPSAPDAIERAAPAANTAAPEDVLDEPYFPPPAAEVVSEPASELDYVQVSRVVESFREDVGIALLREEVDIHRVPVNEYVDVAPPIRYEDDRIIIPVVEEVLLVEKRLLVKEEVVVTKRRTQVTAQQRELRQSTQVLVEPQAGPTGAPVETTNDHFRQHYEAQAHPGARSFAYYEPAYRFGQALQTAARYRGWDWERLEPEARAVWERDNPGAWDSLQPAVRFAWGYTAAR